MTCAEMDLQDICNYWIMYMPNDLTIKNLTACVWNVYQQAWDIVYSYNSPKMQIIIFWQQETLSKANKWRKVLQSYIQVKKNEEYCEAVLLEEKSFFLTTRWL